MDQDQRLHSQYPDHGVGLVLSRKLGAPEAHILYSRRFGSAWDYYRDNPGEIDEAIRLNEKP